MEIERLDASSCIVLFFILLRGLICCWRGLLLLLLLLLLRVRLLLLLRLALAMAAISERLSLFLGGLLPLPLPPPLLGLDMPLLVLLGDFCDAPPLRKLQLLKDFGLSLIVGDSSKVSQRGVFMFALFVIVVSLLPLYLLDVVASHHHLGCCCR